MVFLILIGFPMWLLIAAVVAILCHAVRRLDDEVQAQFHAEPEPDLRLPFAS